jgi:hypothetical protein
VKEFRTALRHAQHAAICECFRAFNRKGGAIVPLQTGGGDVLRAGMHSGDLCRPARGQEMHPYGVGLSGLLHPGE